MRRGSRYGVLPVEEELPSCLHMFFDMTDPWTAQSMYEGSAIVVVDEHVDWMKILLNMQYSAPALHSCDGSHRHVFS